jgi:hypothetical protein
LTKHADEKPWIYGNHCPDSFLQSTTCRYYSKLRATIDSLQKQLADTYKPGLGEFMLGIQLHHAKLWWAGQNQNWPLADFEVNEIKESLEEIQKYCSDRPEVKAIGMIGPVIDSLNHSIQQKDDQSFKRSFVLLTNTCNNCHKATDHGFNVVTIPAALPVTNQEFKPSK